MAAVATAPAKKVSKPADKVMYFRNIGAPHVEKVFSKDEDGKTVYDEIHYPCGSIVPSKKDLRELFRNHFEKVAGPEGGDEVDRPGPPGEDVTELFPDAEAADLQVFKSGKSYNVIDADAPTKTLNDNELISKKEVIAFLKTYLRV